MYTVTKRLEVSASHHLVLDYASKCQNLHGHNWIIHVTCQAEALDHNGMVVDFKTLTGGEPLCQDVHALLAALKGHSVNIETNGSVDIEPYFKYDHVWFTVDYKSLSSDMAGRMLESNFEKLRPQDVLKFVVGDEADLKQALAVYRRYQPKCAVYVGAIFGQIEPAQIVDFMKEHELMDWHLQVQLHKIIWDPQLRGV